MGDLSRTAITRHRLLVATLLTVAAVTLPALPSAEAAPTGTAVALAADPMGPGYWMLMSDGRVIPRGTARRVGGAAAFNGDATGIAGVTRGGGFWRMKRSGAARGFAGADLNARAIADRDSRVVGIAPSRFGTGLWRVTASGDVRASGAAEHLGEPNGTDAAIVAIAAHPEANGYWVLNRDGKVFGYGSSDVMGTAAGAGATGIAPHPSGDGYWVVRANGRVSAFGAAAHYGNVSLDSPVVDIASAPDGNGYWVLTRDARVRAFGSARDGVISLEGPPKPELETVGGIVVDAAIAPKLRRMLRAAREAGIRLGGYGYRSYDRQVELREAHCGPRYYDVYVKSSSECYPMTARPGASMHERGRAIDFYRILSDGRTGDIGGTRAFRWLSRRADNYGFYNLPSEPWHWSTNGH